MKKFAALLYGVLCYFIFFGTFLYAIWFVWTMDKPQLAAAWPRSILINAALLSLFAVQHSIMARQWFKRAWTRVISPVIERSTFVLFASAILLLLIRSWQAMPALIWNVDNEMAQRVLQALAAVGWLTVLISTFLIDHFDLFGLKQVWSYFRGTPYHPPAMGTPAFYKLVRHPIYTGFIIAFWSAPRMTAGHLFFAIMSTAWMLVAIQLEEHDLISFYGDAYRSYRNSVSMLMPWPKSKKAAVPSSAQ
ncbi:MAG: isoprenylcysteine carboxylmethyltransferase family protein [Acidobacteriia bacterium]|nr:isoprenylcysteine carboxylmethyltransferase family protein [Terriglobia bacterium]